METASQYAAAVEVHLANARELLAHPTVEAYGPDAHDRHVPGVMYLAGYVVEAALKNYVVRKYTPGGPWVPTCEPNLADIGKLPGVSLPSDPHSIELWWKFSGLMGREVQMDLDANACSIWRPFWRYVPPQSKRAHADAESFLEASERLARWLLTQS